MENEKNTQQLDKELPVNIYQNFNYVGVKESAAYLLNDVSNTFNIDGFKERYCFLDCQMLG